MEVETYSGRKFWGKIDSFI